MRRDYLGLAFVFAAGCGGAVDAGDLGYATGNDLSTAGKSGDMAIGGGGALDLAGAASDLAGSPSDLAMASKHDMAMLADYPPGPYGADVGSTFPPLLWEGYPDLAGDAIANTKPYGPYLMDDARRSGRAYAMVHVSDFG